MINHVDKITVEKNTDLQQKSYEIKIRLNVLDLKIYNVK